MNDTTETMTACSTERETMLNDVFTTALEGGIGYWSVARLYRWSNGEPELQQINEFRAEIRDIEEDDGEWLVIDAAVIRRGIDRAYDWMREQADRQGVAGLIDNYQTRALRDLKFGKYEDLDYDADTADMIVQFGLFGELVYG